MPGCTTAQICLASAQVRSPLGWCCSPQYPSEVSERIVGHGTDRIRIFASVGFLSFQVSLSSYRAGRAPYEVPGGFSKGDVVVGGPGPSVVEYPP